MQHHVTLYGDGTLHIKTMEHFLLRQGFQCTLFFPFCAYIWVFKDGKSHTKWIHASPSLWPSVKHRLAPSQLSFLYSQQLFRASISSLFTSLSGVACLPHFLFHKVHSVPHITASRLKLFCLLILSSNMPLLLFKANSFISLKPLILTSPSSNSLLSSHL